MIRLWNKLSLEGRAHGRRWHPEVGRPVPQAGYAGAVPGGLPGGVRGMARSAQVPRHPDRLRHDARHPLRPGHRGPVRAPARPRRQRVDVGTAGRRARRGTTGVRGRHHRRPRRQCADRAGHRLDGCRSLARRGACRPRHRTCAPGRPFLRRMAGAQSGRVRLRAFGHRDLARPRGPASASTRARSAARSPPWHRDGPTLGSPTSSPTTRSSCRANCWNRS